MKFLLDTNVISEVTKPRPDTNVLRWLDVLDEDRAFISVISLAEIRRGVALMESGRRRETLAAWLAHDLPQRFDRRILNVDAAVAITWGDLMADARKAGRGLSTMDGLIAASALAFDLTIATRNIKDFHGLGIALVDPWQ